MTSGFLTKLFEPGTNFHKKQFYDDEFTAMFDFDLMFNKQGVYPKKCK